MRRRPHVRGLALMFAVCLALVACANQGAGGPDRDTGFKGKRITLIIPNQPGQSMDSYGRMIAPYLNTCLGSSRIDVRNLTGAGGVRGTNQLWRSKADGLTIAFASVPSIILSDLAESEGVTFEAKRFTYLGRVSTEPRVLAVGGKSSLGSVDDLRGLDRPFVFPSQGTDEDFFTMAVLADSLGFPLKIVTGFQGNGDTALAVVSGKADGQITALSDAQPMIEAGDKKPILMVGSERAEGYPDTPTATETVTGDGKGPVEAIVSMLEMHRSFFAPPDMDETATTKLREAVACALAKPELRDEAKTAKLPLAPLDGGEVQEKVGSVYAENASLAPILKNALESIQ
ncbi:MAG: hypothetical protein GEV10_06040 [Streptosporangiales bacterium]|nr:hypothetical protein [Streptosporangiales bacterium]